MSKKEDIRKVIQDSLRLKDEVNEREEEVYKVVNEQQNRISRLVRRVLEMNEMERMYEISKEMIKQKVIYRLVWEEIDRIHFYSKKLQRDLSIEEVKENKKEAIEDLNNYLEEMGYEYNVYYIERHLRLTDKVKKVNMDDSLSGLMILGGDKDG